MQDVIVSGVQRRRSLAAAAFFAAVFLIAPTGAESKLVLQRAIAGVELHMTKTQVRAVLGKPTRIRTGTNPGGPFTQFVYSRVTVEFQRVPTVTALRTSSRLERTTAGVGVGSTEAAVKAAAPQVACDDWNGQRQCILGKLRPDVWSRSSRSKGGASRTSSSASFSTPERLP